MKSILVFLSVKHFLSSKIMCDRSAPHLASAALLNRWRPTPCSNCGFQSAQHPSLPTLLNSLLQLYNQTHVQCSSCGIRTSSIADHLDWHFRNNREFKSTVSRKWYAGVKDWSKGDSNTAVVHDTPPNQGFKQMCVSTSNRNKVCPLCLEKFDVFYHQDEEEWFFNNTVEVNDVVFHPHCMS